MIRGVHGEVWVPVSGEDAATCIGFYRLLRRVGLDRDDARLFLFRVLYVGRRSERSEHDHYTVEFMMEFLRHRGSTLRASAGIVLAVLAVGSRLRIDTRGPARSLAARMMGEPS